MITTGVDKSNALRIAKPQLMTTLFVIMKYLIICDLNSSAYLVITKKKEGVCLGGVLYWNSFMYIDNEIKVFRMRWNDRREQKKEKKKRISQGQLIPRLFQVWCLKLTG